MSELTLPLNLGILTILLLVGVLLALVAWKRKKKGTTNKIWIRALNLAVIFIGLTLILSNLVSTPNFNIGLALILLAISNIHLTNPKG